MEVGLVRLVRSRRTLVLTLLVALVGGALLSGTGSALAQEPAPPPNPSDDDLRRSREAVDARAGEVARLTATLAELDRRTDDLQAALAAQRETAEAALVELQNARDAAAAAKKRAEAARIETQAATVAIEQARARLDEIVSTTYLQGLDAGPLGLLTEATSPEDLLARAEYTDLVARTQLQAQEGLERARVDKANADSAARAALEAAKEAEAGAAAAKVVADRAFAAAQAAARAQAEQLAQVAAERAAVQRRLDATESADANLRAQRQRFADWQRQMAQERAARERAERDAAAARVAVEGRADVRGTAAVRRVIDRAMSQIGVQYVWGGGNGRGPSTGIPDAFGSPLNRVGFDCSGLMQYAFSGVGVSLPRVSRNQFHAGEKVPVSQIRAGDMIFFQNPGAPIHHVAMYIGGGKMIEAPYTGASVRVVPMRTKGLLPQAVRVV